MKFSKHELTLIYSFIGLIILWLLFSLTINIPTIWNIVLMPIITGILSGLLTSLIQSWHQKNTRLKCIKKELKMFEGNYQVYHWRDTIIPDSCNYQINIKLDEKEAIFVVIHKGTKDYDEWESKIKIEEMTFRYGEGNYKHPKKENTPTGRIQIYLINDGVINVDKSYVDMKDKSRFVPEWEKWQWKREELK